MPTDPLATAPPPFYRFMRSIVRGPIRALGGVSIRGAENIPTEGPVILAPNHRAHVDPPYLSQITLRQVHFMAKEELFQIPLFGAMLRGVESFPVRRGTADRAALRHAVDLLKEGRIVAIFPEGTRSTATHLGEAEKGFALIARQSAAVIIPVAIEGTEKVLPRGSIRLRRSPVTITVGQPLSIEAMMAVKPEEQKDILAWIGTSTMTAIGSLMQRTEAETAPTHKSKKRISKSFRNP